MGLEFGKQRKLFVGRKAITGRVCNDRNTASASDPTDSIFKRCPAMRHKTWFVFGQVLAKHFGGVFAHATFYQKAGKVSA